MNIIITTQHGKRVIASGSHRQAAPVLEEACYNCRYHYIKTAAQEPCYSCYCKNGRLTKFEPKCVEPPKPTREATEQIIMEHMKFIRDAYKAYTDEPVQDLSLMFGKTGQISFFNYFASKNEHEPIYKVEE